MVCMGTCVGRRHVYQIDTYNLSKVWVRCGYRQYLVKYGSCDGCLTITKVLMMPHGMRTGWRVDTM